MVTPCHNIGDTMLLVQLQCVTKIVTVVSQWGQDNL